MQQILSASIKHSGDGVSETFFNQPSENAVFGEHDFTGLRNKLAVAVISKDLTNVSILSLLQRTSASRHITIITTIPSTVLLLQKYHFSL